MAKDDPLAVLVQPGDLIWNPTDLTGTTGTNLGYMEEGIEILPNFTTVPIPGGENGAQRIDELYVGADAILEVQFTQWDDETLEVAFPSGLTAVGPSTGDKIVQIPGTTKPGTLMSKFAGKLLFIPDDPDSNKIVLGHRVEPMLMANARLRSWSQNWTILPVMFRFLPNDTIGSGATEYPYRAMVIGDRSDISLNAASATP